MKSTLTIEFDEKEQKMLKAFKKLDQILESEKGISMAAIQAHNVLSNSTARLIARKLENVPWEE